MRANARPKPANDAAHPLATPTDLSSKQAAAVATALNGLLADVFILQMKTRNFHWHVSGPDFRDIHEARDGRSIVIISHQERIIQLADEIVVLRDGRVAVPISGGLDSRSTVATMLAADAGAEGDLDGDRVGRVCGVGFVAVVGAGKQRQEDHHTLLVVRQSGAITDRPR